MTHRIMGIQKFMFISQRHNGSNSKSVMGNAITHNPILQHPGQLSRHVAQTAERRQGWLHQVLCISESLSDSVQFLKKPLIKKFNRRLNHIIQCVFLVSDSFLHSNQSSRSLACGFANTTTHTQHFLSSFVSFGFLLFLLFYSPWLFTLTLSSTPILSPHPGSVDVSGRQHMCRIIRFL